MDARRAVVGSGPRRAVDRGFRARRPPDPLRRRLARPASDGPVVERAAGRDHWRETSVGVPLDTTGPAGITVEGYIDLVFRDDDGLVVVDYKTDAVDAAVLTDRLAHYRVQAGAY